MSAERWFLDTNVLVYLFDAKEPDKQAIAQSLWRRACQEAIPVLSTQVLQEFFATVTKAAKQGLPIATAREAILDFSEIAEVAEVTVPLIAAATRRIETSGFSFWDSLIIETALASGARRLWTEDLQDGQVIGDLTVVNPFRSMSNSGQTPSVPVSGV
ncbi:PIN domain-containing protein [Thiorhodococcus mannitoliphagus]|uniref:Ribonuclease VapC n=1 Tax=Thiorhodococcus mannitoliphagus TaxID=329406 RepID=A0A6P1DRS8_9GAMM|nr:PIN domain-containing protein [Thiorhodococcus mannitoliphagus]NEX19873.1 PIN domain-containing protein [Thiorhodococcus mannitoliphagus]